ncbi:MAG: hypothetical protein N3A38_11700 [Planctomycetota bacterium]|nr:hypothetical protein [Planctomycetota bacterium]
MRSMSPVTGNYARGLAVPAAAAAAAVCLLLAGGCGGEDDQMAGLKLSLEEYRRQVTRYHTEALEQREIVEAMQKNQEAQEKKIQALTKELVRLQERIRLLEQALKGRAPDAQVPGGGAGREGPVPAPPAQSQGAGDAGGGAKAGE